MSSISLVDFLTLVEKESVRQEIILPFRWFDEICLVIGLHYFKADDWRLLNDHGRPRKVVAVEYCNLDQVIILGKLFPKIDLRYRLAVDVLDFLPQRGQLVVLGLYRSIVNGSLLK